MSVTALDLAKYATIVQLKNIHLQSFDPLCGETQHTHHQSNFKRSWGKHVAMKSSQGLDLGLVFLLTSPLYAEERRGIYFKVARNVNGVNRFIVNTEEYKQGVSIVECHSDAVGRLIFILQEL